jgi:hypothetical protein
MHAMTFDPRCSGLIRMQGEILEDIRRGVVPDTVGSFSELHDYVDANGYGGAFEAWFEGCCESDAFCRFWDRAQNACDRWLKAGRP